MDFTKLLEYGPVAAIAGVLLWMLANQLKIQNENFNKLLDKMEAQLKEKQNLREQLLSGQAEMKGMIRELPDDIAEKVNCKQ